MEVQTLQTRITNVLGKNVVLTNVVQIMLFRRILPCQRGTSPMWEFNPEEPHTLQHFLDTTHAGIWKLLFKAQKSWPMKTEDIGLDIENPASEVIINFFEDLFGQYFRYNRNYIVCFPYRAGRQRWSGSTVRHRCLKIQPFLFLRRCRTDKPHV